MRVPNEASPRRPWAIAVAILVAVPLAAGIVYAAIPDATNQRITVCYKPHTGEMRLIDTEAVPACDSDEEELAWNQRGPQGPPGEQGPQGTPGQQGPPGLSQLEIVTGRTPATGGDSDSAKVATATCDPGSVVVGTAVNIDGVPPNGINGGSVAVDEIIPINNNTAARAVAFEDPPGTSKNWALTAYAFCARVQ